jgi:hypothetical protein
METPFGSGGFQPGAAYADAAQRFLELMQSFAAPAAGKAPDWSSLTGPLAGQFEQWLRLSQASGPWFAAGGAPFAPAAGLGAMPAGSFGPLPLGPAAVQNSDAQRSFELLGRLGQLQGQLAAHWSEIANTAARRFVARLGASAAAPATLDQGLKLYQLWVSCAEEAYAATAHREDFSRLQAEMANASAALLVEQRRHAEALVKAFGLPTRNEVDALYAQLKELRGQLAALADSGVRRAAQAAQPAPAPRSRAGGGARKAAKGRRKRGPGR